MTIYQLPAAPRGFDDVGLFGGGEVPFLQGWRAHPQKDLQPGHVRLGWTPDALWLYAEMDGAGNTNATEDNQELWVLGDVVELFVGYADQPEYFEIHTAPNGLILQLRFPNSAAIRALRNPLNGSLLNYVVDCGWKAEVRNMAGGWQVLASLPMALEAEAELHIACGRYDYATGKHVISNTASLLHSDFHRRSEWSRARLSASRTPELATNRAGEEGHRKDAESSTVESIPMEQGVTNG